MANTQFDEKREGKERKEKKNNFRPNYHTHATYRRKGC
jgi:hypothetical protein